MCRGRCVSSFRGGATLSPPLAASAIPPQRPFSAAFTVCFAPLRFADNDAHMLWIYEAALARAERYGIPVRRPPGTSPAALPLAAPPAPCVGNLASSSVSFRSRPCLPRFLPSIPPHPPTVLAASPLVQIAGRYVSFDPRRRQEHHPCDRLDERVRRRDLRSRGLQARDALLRKSRQLFDVRTGRPPGHPRATPKRAVACRRSRSSPALPHRRTRPRLERSLRPLRRERARSRPAAPRRGLFAFRSCAGIPDLTACTR